MPILKINTTYINSGTMMTLGDIIAQTTIDKRKITQLDLKRTVRFTVLGAFVVVSFEKLCF